jgi:peptidoglycan/LPS O-acetylase OafA/YrhL
MSQLLKNALHWLAFTVFQAPDLNGFNPTSLIVAGVTWSLPYEWFFYLCLPVLALLSGRRPPILFLVIGVASTAVFSNPGMSLERPEIDDPKRVDQL